MVMPKKLAAIAGAPPVGGDDVDDCVLLLPPPHPVRTSRQSTDIKNVQNLARGLAEKGNEKLDPGKSTSA
jgi:hypothetical protein